MVLNEPFFTRALGSQKEAIRFVIINFQGQITVLLACCKKVKSVQQGDITMTSLAWIPIKREYLNLPELAKNKDPTW